MKLSEIVAKRMGVELKDIINGAIDKEIYQIVSAQEYGYKEN